MTTKKISTVNAGFLIGTALLFDGIQFVLTLTVIGTVVAWFVSAFAWILFLIWFALLGVNYFDKGAATKVLTVFASVIAELMPIVNALPGITLGVVALVVQNRIAYAKERESMHAKAPTRSRGTAQSKEAIQQREAMRTARVAAPLLRHAQGKNSRSTLMGAGRVAREARARRNPSPADDKYREPLAGNEI